MQSSCQKFADVILACKDELAAALTQDIGKSPYEAELEISLTLKTLLEQCKSAEFASLSERKKTLRNGGFTALPIGSGLIIGHDACMSFTITQLYLARVEF